MSLKIRDFIYLDTDRLKSILAQIEQGVINDTTQVKSNNIEASVGAEGSFFGLLKSDGNAKYLWENQNTETKALHDYIYNKVEGALVSDDLLITIPGALNQEDINDSGLMSLVDDTSFVLATGKVNINDFAQIRLILENFNELDKFVTQVSLQSIPSAVPKSAMKSIPKKNQPKKKMDEAKLNGLKLLLDVFYQDRIVIKMLPFADCPDFCLVGNLKKHFLRDNISSIIHKYSTAPVSEWTVFAQVASIPPKDRSNNGYNTGGTAIEAALQGMFNSVRELELLAQSVVYPEIAITPIAIYRQ